MGARESKEKIVAEILENIEKSEGIVIVDYRGLDVKQLTELRSNYREKNVNYKVYKNTLVRIAFDQAGIEIDDEILSGPNAFAFGMTDPVSVAKVTSDFSKENEDLEIKAGVVGLDVLDKDQVIALSKLPSEEELRGMTVNVINAPLTQIAGTTSAILSKVVYAVNAIKDKKEGEEEAA